MVLMIAGALGASSESLEENMRQTDNGERKTTSLVGTIALVVISYLLAKLMPDIVRYIKISRM
jgi:hypothetical protein